MNHAFQSNTTHSKKTVGDKVKFKLKFTKEAAKRTQPKSKEVVIPKPHVKPKPAPVKQKPTVLLKIVMMRKMESLRIMRSKMRL